MNIVSTRHLNPQTVQHFFIDHWGSSEMVVSTGVYDCKTLDGFAALNEQQDIVGLITYIIKADVCEIVSLDSVEEGKGIGTALLKRLETLVQEHGYNRIQLITTNDNLNALRFYQKRGYQLMRVFPNAVEKARRLKPSIPLTGFDGIPIRDELLLEKQVEQNISQ
ncbi:GNAT family N-acetyltransferase [Anoxybacteroides tepidamans]|uniref:GNAT family N-acetyltransferase n=1 Tax=Anoxybacteroides tepidamans TaxID=265948 RepID=UPI0004886481|nr:GNAT family N-acetyltransferase [Anoxybacillus tepidamans]